MKKTRFLLPVLLLFLFGFGATAQMATKGIKGGVNASNLGVDGLATYEFYPSFHAGLFFRTAPIERISLQLEFLYSAQGAELNDGETAQLFSTYSGGTVRLNYLSLPVMARINFLDNRLGVLVGPGLNYLLNAGDDGDLDGSGEELRALYNDFDFTVQFGLEYDITSGLLIGTRTSISLGNIMSGDNAVVDGPLGLPITYPTVNGDVTNFVAQGYIGLIF